MTDDRIIPYIPADQNEPKELLARIRSRRGGTLINLDRMLLHSAPFAEGWNTFLGGVRDNLSLNEKYRELAILAVACLNHCEFQYAQHLRPFLCAGGTMVEADALKTAFGTDEFQDDLFSADERDVLLLTRQITRDLIVDDSLKRRVRDKLGVRDTVELVGVISTYNMVSRFLLALDVTSES